NGKIIGMTAHNVSESEEAQRIGADYVGLSPIFATSTKKDAGNPCGTAMIKKARAKIKIPIVAIGGISRENVAEAIKSGADSAAAISAVMCSNDIQKEVSCFINTIRWNKK
ncbi:thiamine phosphate synthase, partial [Candidatus Woesearchaeota archaeon]|nr:thiamine phosphate synthase [Candidatus Woesearchaeota archaeon]